MDYSVIENILKNWEIKSDSVTNRVALFEKVRDIPYFIEKSLLDPRQHPTEILTTNRGSCSPKHYLLGLMYERIGLDARYISQKFSWNDATLLNLFPDDLKKFASKFPVIQHFNLEVFIENEWVLVDATFDLELKKLGFKINEKWDGFSNQNNAFTTWGSKQHKTAWDCASYIQSQRDKMSKEEKLASNQFVGSFNTWRKTQ